MIETLFYSLLWLFLSGGLFLLALYLISHLLQPQKNASTLTNQLYIGGESIQVVERRYLESTIQFVAYFSVLDIIGIFLGTLFIRNVIDASLITSATIIFIIILLLTIFLFLHANEEWKKSMNK